MIKTFRGILRDGAYDTIRLSTKQGKIGYRIVTFGVFPAVPDGSHETLTKIYSVASENVTTPTLTVDFSDGNLLGAAWYAFEGSGSSQSTGYLNVVFDNMIFNQDIYIANKCGQGSAMNYYLELEVMNLNDNEATVSTLKDIRGSS